VSSGHKANYWGSVGLKAHLSNRIVISKVYVHCSSVLSGSTSELLHLGKVRPEIVKRTARELLRKFPDRFSGDFEADKQAVNELVLTQSKRLRNRIAGYVTRLKAIEAQRQAATAETAPESPSPDIG